MPRTSSRACRLSIVITSLWLVATALSGATGALAQEVELLEVLGADRYQVEQGLAVETVRLLGVRVPPLTSQCGGREAVATARDVFGRDRRLRLETDPGHDRDSVGDLLRHIAAFRSGRDLGRILVSRGLGVVDRHLDFARCAELVALEDRARRDRVGLWGACPELLVGLRGTPSSTGALALEARPLDPERPVRRIAPSTPPPESEPPPKMFQEPETRCCRICRKGKACGNSCISRQLTCRKPPGCACDG